MSEDSGIEGIKIRANNIDGAVGEILGVIEDRSKGNVMYFHGWDGLGASAALKMVAECLKSSTRLNNFDKVIHVDCSVWRSRRALQKTIAKELQLPVSVMAIFDRCDEDDDFHGVDEGSREEVGEVWGHIFRCLVNSTFVVIFDNGSNGYVDLSEFGIPVYPHLGNKMLWTFHGRSRSYFLAAEDEKEIKKLVGHTRGVLWCGFTVEGDERGSPMWGILHEEAKDVAERIGMPEYVNPRIVEECFLYMLPLQKMKHIDSETHAFNYWVCDGIVQGDTSAWEIGDAIQSNIHLDWSRDFMNYARDVPVPRQLPVYCSSSEITNVPPEVTSFFVEATDGADTVLPAGVFQYSGSSALRVLHVSFCTFSFAMPPFLCCSNLRFLLLDHCKDKDDHTNDVHEEHASHGHSESWVTCFQRLWVLDLRYTDWYQLLSEEMMRLMADLRELNVEGVKEKGENWSITDLCGCGTRLVKLRVIVDPIPAEDKEISEDNLKMVMPPSLESFSFINKATTAAKIFSISFQGCSQMKSIVLAGFLGSLMDLDLSGTSVKTLDLREVEAPNLTRLILLGCDKLCAILWPPENKRKNVLEVLHINTIRSASPREPKWEESTNEASAATRSSSIRTVATSEPSIGQAVPSDFNWYMFLRDARLLNSIVPLQKYFEQGNVDIETDSHLASREKLDKLLYSRNAISLGHLQEGRGNACPIDYSYGHIEMDSSPKSSVVVGGNDVAQGIRNLQQPDKYLYARDAIFLGHLQSGAGSEGAISWMWDCPASPTPRDYDWYVHIQDEVEMKSGLLQQPAGSTEETIPSAALTPAFVCNNSRMMHVHDSLAITCIPCQQSSDWHCLQWCRVERCPKIRSVFAAPQVSVRTHFFWYLETLWASQLPKACDIWNWSATSQPGRRSFEDLAFLHLDYCPRLIHVLPFSEYMTTLRYLKTIEIVCCGDLREVFPLDPKRTEGQKIIGFPRLKCIHLYELPLLQHICGSKMLAPELETVKIRGCWSLKRLPAVSGSTTKRPKVDCEKDWWDNLEWDGLAANHHPSLYELTHSMYYKKAQLPRGPLLR